MGRVPTLKKNKSTYLRLSLSFFVFFLGLGFSLVLAQ